MDSRSLPLHLTAGRLRKEGTREFPITSPFNLLTYLQGRGCGVGRGLGIALGVAVGVGVGDRGGSLGVGVGEGKSVGVGDGLGGGVVVAVAVAVGVGDGPPPTAAKISTRPQPYTLFGGPASPHWVSLMCTAELFNASRLAVSWWRRLGIAFHNKAMAPAICGVAMDVPLKAA